jgi:hypothetical protein
LCPPLSFQIQCLSSAIPLAHATKKLGHNGGTCSAERGLVFRFDGQLLRFTVGHNVSPEFRDFLEGNPIVPGRNSNAGRAALERCTVHNLDVQNDPENPLNFVNNFSALSAELIDKMNDVLKDARLIRWQEARRVR